MDEKVSANPHLPPDMVALSVRSKREREKDINRILANVKVTLDTHPYWLDFVDVARDGDCLFKVIYIILTIKMDI